MPTWAITLSQRKQIRATLRADKVALFIAFAKGC